MAEDTDRAQRGAETFEKVVGRPIHPASSPFTEAAQNFVLAEVWARPGLDLRSRRWITLACVCAARAPMAIKTYMKAALDSGEITVDEMREFILQFGVFQGFPKAAEAELILGEILRERDAS
jgi:4-carboxymuconolactone decarboxylase